MTNGEPETVVSASLQKIKWNKNPIKHFSFFHLIKSETSDSFINHFDGHFAYLKILDFYFKWLRVRQVSYMCMCFVCFTGGTKTGASASFVFFLLFLYYCTPRFLYPTILVFSMGSASLPQKYAFSRTIPMPEMFTCVLILTCHLMPWSVQQYMSLIHFLLHYSLHSTNKPWCIIQKHYNLCIIFYGKIFKSKFKLKMLHGTYWAVLVFIRAKHVVFISWNRMQVFLLLIYFVIMGIHFIKLN